MLRGDLAHHPAHRIDDVRFAAAVRADDADQITGKVDCCWVHKGLEPGQFDFAESHRAPERRNGGTLKVVLVVPEHHANTVGDAASSTRIDAATPRFDHRSIVRASVCDRSARDTRGLAEKLQLEGAEKALCTMAVRGWLRLYNRGPRVVVTCPEAASRRGAEALSMAAKKPSAKATKAKKTVVKKAEPAKKAAPAKKPAVKSKPAASTRAPAAKPAAKSTAKAAPVAKPTKSAAATGQPVAKAAPKPTPKPAPAPAAPAKAIIAAKPVIPISLDSDTSNGNDADDADSPESLSTNLLAGPRNVKPYIPRRGEQYMNKEQLEHFRQILNTWKRDLMQEVDRTVLHMKDEAANFPDPNDRATQESEFSLELRTRDRERKLIRKIEEALKRIDDGTYGYCNETGEEIGIKRLEARPVATLCVEAQERRERREKQYGDRDDRYR